MTPVAISGGPKNERSAKAESFRGPFSLMTLLFFMWGFMTVWNDLLIPRFKEAFTLGYFQAMLVQFAFFGAYTVGAIVYYSVSITSGDPINRIGYKNGVVLGLLVAALGSALFFPAAQMASYGFFLIALSVMGLGFAVLQIAANPYVTILGPEATASSRLNLAQAFNSLGTTIGPILGGWLIFKVFTHPGAHGAAAVKIPYICFAAIFCLMAVVFKIASLPSFSSAEPSSKSKSALQYPHTILGMVAIFMYVGGEVSVGSAIINFLGLPKMGGFDHEMASGFLSYYWGGLMIGRFMGSFSLSTLRTKWKITLMLVIPTLSFGLIIFAADLSTALHYGAFLLVLLLAFAIGSRTPQRLLAVFSIVIIALLLMAIFGQGTWARWSVLAVGMFCSVMWSNIFSLAIRGLGELKSQASALLIMAIFGGALLPPVQGLVADRAGIQWSLAIPVFAFAYVAFYGIYGCRAGRK